MVPHAAAADKKILHYDKILIVIGAIVLVIISSIHKRNEEAENRELLSMFNDFVSKYGRKFESPEIKEKRFHTFKENVMGFKEEEKRNPGVKFGVTQFTDWTEKELKDMFYHKTNATQTCGLQEPVKFEKCESSRPVSFDWRNHGKLAPVKYQRRCGSCWAFATVAVVEAQHAIKTGELVSLSEQQLVDCDIESNGCKGGDIAMNYVMKYGLEKEEDYPYRGVRGNQCLQNENNTKVFISDFKQLPPNEDEIADWIAKNGPVAIGMNPFYSIYDYLSGIISPSIEDCQKSELHAMAIVGYGVRDGKPYWIIKNSWGPTWGENGYLLLEKGVNSCGVVNNVVAPIIH